MLAGGRGGGAKRGRVGRGRGSGSSTGPGSSLLDSSAGEQLAGHKLHCQNFHTSSILPYLDIAASSGTEAMQENTCAGTVSPFIIPLRCIRSCDQEKGYRITALRQCGHACRQRDICQAPELCCAAGEKQERSRPRSGESYGRRQA